MPWLGRPKRPSQHFSAFSRGRRPSLCCCMMPLSPPPPPTPSLHDAEETHAPCRYQQSREHREYESGFLFSGSARLLSLSSARSARRETPTLIQQTRTQTTPEQQGLCFFHPSATREARSCPRRGSPQLKRPSQPRGTRRPRPRRLRPRPCHFVGSRVRGSFIFVKFAGCLESCFVWGENNAVRGGKHWPRRRRSPMLLFSQP